jgi:DNA-binding transcriptional regulator YbjK
MKRRLNAEERRRVLCDAAIEVLAQEGARGLTHRKVERRAGLPDGTTSSYFPTRSALLRATAERVAELDVADFEAVTTQPSPEAAAAATTLSLLAEMVMRSAAGLALNRSRARYELALHAHRDAVLREAFDDAIAGFVALSEQAVMQVQPDGFVDRALVEEQARAVTTFINGVMVRQVLGPRPVDSVEELTRLLHALVVGIAASRDVHASQV